MPCYESSSAPSPRASGGSPPPPSDHLPQELCEEVQESGGWGEAPWTGAGACFHFSLSYFRCSPLLLFPSSPPLLTSSYPMQGLQEKGRELSVALGRNGAPPGRNGAPTGRNGAPPGRNGAPPLGRGGAPHHTEILNRVDRREETSIGREGSNLREVQEGSRREVRRPVRQLAVMEPEEEWGGGQVPRAARQRGHRHGAGSQDGAIQYNASNTEVVRTPNMEGSVKRLRTGDIILNATRLNGAPP